MTMIYYVQFFNPVSKWPSGEMLYQPFDRVVVKELYRCATEMVMSSFRFVFLQLTLFVSFLSRVKMNSTN